VPWGKGSYFQLTQSPTAASTMVSGTVAVNDNTASGYMDIGTMRIQYGTHNDANVDTTTVTFPMPFANTNYSVNATSNTSAGSLCTEAKTTTTFDIDRASTTTTTQVYSWFAIGLKP
jgi:bacteriorhodopsin